MRRLALLGAYLEAGKATLLARYGQPARSFADCMAEWHPDLVVAGIDPGYLSGRHDLLTLGQSGAGGGRIGRWLHALTLVGLVRA